MFKNVKDIFNSWSISKRSINLPSYHDMTKNDQDRVIEVVKNCMINK